MATGGGEIVDLLLVATAKLLQVINQLVALDL